MAWALWRTFWPVLLGAALVAVGARTRHRGAWLAVAVLVGAGTAASYGLSLAWPGWRLISGNLFGPLGGEPTVACWAGLLLVGLVAGLPNRRCSRAVPWLGGLALSLLMVINGPCPLFWHLHAASQANRPRDGLLAQSTSWTCTAASSAMLLAHWGIAASEGELAEAAGTSPVMGTDPIAMARVLRRYAAARGLRVRVARLDYSAAGALRRPLVASIRLDSGLGHSVLVERLDSDGVDVADPLGGRRYRRDRERWTRQWRDVCVWLEPAD